ncbi:hypothetical protein [Marivirga sp.]|uniref:hypothetical protein n=1 Tax=Marivirga sp. TaxID=2018662 RepID=UPI002D7EAA9A|nr:hypothetical protein [Marivirga sp.]HET8860373.1 hypothetical protein [Marivirga sp.]
MAATCQDTNSKVQDKNEEPCDPDIMCTMEFKIIDLEIVDSEGKAVLLDEFYIEIEGEKIDIPDDVYETKDGFYPVATDGQMEILSFDGNEVVFFGAINGANVVEHKMIIGKDCCHIQLVEGDQKLIISP